MNNAVWIDVSEAFLDNYLLGENDCMCKSIFRTLARLKITNSDK
jgi:hypothetical protein